MRSDDDVLGEMFTTAELDRAFAGVKRVVIEPQARAASLHDVWIWRWDSDSRAHVEQLADESLGQAILRCLAVARGER